MDAAGEFGKRYGTGDNGMVTIRPDGYIGMIARPAGNDAITAYRAALSLTMSSYARYGRSRAPG